MPVTPDSLTIEAPSRLHLGMFAIGEAGTRRPAGTDRRLVAGAGSRRQFGGVGLMVTEPRLRVILRPAAAFACEGLHAERAERIARQVAGRWLGGHLPSCVLAVQSAPREHVGLGLGTQLSLAVGVALTRFSGMGDPPSPIELAVELGRARRSSVGTHGFVHGGLIVEAGHARGEPLGPLVARAELPESWRVVIIIPCGPDGLSGSREVDAFGGLPPVPPPVTDCLSAEVLLEMLPAARGKDFDEFAQSVSRFGQKAGVCFAEAQGGPYSPEAAPLVARLRELGAIGVGQSSWGPGVFALAADAEAGDELRRRLVNEPLAAGADVIISQPDNRGAVIALGSGVPISVLAE
jgi:beta-RFAP synthase